MNDRKMLCDCPALAKQWDYSKNTITPADVTQCSGKHVWWVCGRGHSWNAQIANRQKGTGCPYCSGRKAIPGETDLATIRPDVAIDWDYDKNEGRTPRQFTAQSNEEIWWKCKNGHSWKAPIDRRYQGRGCPYCAGIAIVKGVNDLQSQYPFLAKEWDSHKNRQFSDEVHAYSNKYAWWLCRKGHSWRAIINNRSSKGRGCPFCSGFRAISGETDLLTRCPILAAQWDYNKNNVDIHITTEYSHRKVWWKCDKGHSWQAAVNGRHKGNGCPYCAGQKPIPDETDLLTLAPAFIAEWDYERNTVSITDLTLKSNVKVWWICENGHRWKTQVYVRAIGCGCPYCAGKVIYSAKNVR